MERNRIYIALGANLPGPDLSAPRKTLVSALSVLPAEKITVIATSPWYRSPAWPPSDQPDYVNGVARVASALSPEAFLTALHRIEAQFGRRRAEEPRYSARPLDLDLIDWDGEVLTGQGGQGPICPHPRMQDRAFVLKPLLDIAPQEWRHPQSGLSAQALLNRLDDAQDTQRLEAML
ncbi:MAG: 2-amino-4-hydroxy-6-hydroxymethyldihydropteridine diphosphokinase [Rhodospirillaceae bacterium]